MIARVWRGTTRAEQADAYYEYLLKTGAAACAATAGNLGVEIRRRVDGAIVEFVFVSYWTSMDAVRQFAGADVDRAVYYPHDRELLLDLVERINESCSREHLARRGFPARSYGTGPLEMEPTFH